MEGKLACPYLKVYPQCKVVTESIAAVFRSVSKCDWDKTGGALLNQKLTPDIVEDPETLKKLGQLIRASSTWRTPRAVQRG